MRFAMWATVAMFVAVLLFEVGVVGPCMFIAVAGVLSAGVVLPLVNRWAGGG